MVFQQAREGGRAAARGAHDAGELLLRPTADAQERGRILSHLPRDKNDFGQKRVNRLTN